MNSPIQQFNDYITPIKQWQDSNENTLAKLFKLQRYYVNDVMGASLNQFNSLSSCSNSEQALKLNFYFCKGLEAHANYFSDQTIMALSEAHSNSLKSWDEASDKLAYSLDQMLSKNLRPFPGPHNKSKNSF